VKVTKEDKVKYLVLGTWDNGETFDSVPVIAHHTFGRDVALRQYIQYGLENAMDACKAFDIQVIRLADCKYFAVKHYERGPYGAFVDRSPSAKRIG
jgi:hypothetical protein